jgi:integrative and conjugative element protein (TIGR02256 family)
MAILETKYMSTHSKVIFSQRAFTALLAETKEKIKTETGGIFLGVRHDDAWYVVDAIDPGPKSIFQAAYFEYDGDYVRHLANKVNRLYGDRLDVLGLWHRHPGSMDTFSSTDDGTIKKFAEQNDGLTISALVNIDPHFRLTMYVATLDPLAYQKIPYEVDDSQIPLEVRDVISYEDLEKQVNAINEGGRPSSQAKREADQERFFKYLAKYLKKAEHYALDKDAPLKNSDDDCNLLIDDYIVDECLFCDEIGIPYSCDRKEGNEIELAIGDEQAAFKLSFYMAKKKQLCFVYNEKLYHYKGNLLKKNWKKSEKT